MKTGRLEAFSDGVMAIIITIMILGIKVPHGNELIVLKPLIPFVLSYLLSFIYIGIYWNNHHHMMHGTERVNGNILWANLHLLFWLSLIPFTTAWMGENHFGKLPLALYGIILFMAAIAYWLLQAAIIAHNGKNSILSKAIGKDLKGKISPILYLIAIPMAFVNEWVSGILYVIVAGMWLIPDKRIEEKMDKQTNK
jgi:uncharacterized membrane protein